MGEEFKIDFFARVIPGEMVPTMDRLYLMEIPVMGQDEEAILEEVSKVAWEIKELSIRERLKRAGALIRKEPENGELVAGFTDLTAELQRLLEEKALIASK